MDHRGAHQCTKRRSELSCCMEKPKWCLNIRNDLNILDIVFQEQVAFIFIGCWFSSLETRLLTSAGKTLADICVA